MTHERYEIWEQESANDPEYPWRLQLVNYIAEFPSKVAAEQYRDFVKVERKRLGLP